MTTGLVLLSILVLFLAAGAVSQATMGVAIVAVAVWIAVLARIAQAKEQHAELIRRMESRP